MLELNISLIFISALVGILFLVLNRLYCKPIGQVLEARESKITNDTNLIETNLREIEEKTQHIEAVLKKNQKDSRKTREELIRKGEEVREQLVLNARENSKKRLETQMKQLDEQIVTAEKTLELEISSFSDEIKEKFLS